MPPKEISEIRQEDHETLNLSYRVSDYSPGIPVMIIKKKKYIFLSTDPLIEQKD